MSERRRSHPSASRSPQRPRAPTATASSWLLRRTWQLPAWAYAGVGLLFLSACAFGILEVHYSTDTWIGLVAGRQILNESSFPILDAFSYTCSGKPWINQNWLSHVFFWLLYDRLGPTAMVFGTWLVGVGIFALVLATVRVRGGSWLASTLAAALVAISSRDWLSIRPATIQFFLIAALWLCLSALLRPSDRRPYWPMVGLVPVLALWPHAHGSFAWGFGMLALFLACALVARISRKTCSVSGRQIWVLAGSGLVLGCLGAVASPYGVENYLHPLKVVESGVFRRVGEWLPPYVSAPYPPVLRFWIAVAMAAAWPLVLLGARRRFRRQLDPASEGDQPIPPLTLQSALMDVAAVGIGLSMALFARRFAPVFFILATPAIVANSMRLARALPLAVRRNSAVVFVLAAWVVAAATTYLTMDRAWREMYKKAGPGDYNLLDRVTTNYKTPREAFDLLKSRGLAPNVMTDWLLAGPLLLAVPGTHVFLDGRAQQVYSEEQLLEYLAIMEGTYYPDRIAEVLEKSNTEMVLLPQWARATALPVALEEIKGWGKVFDSPKGTIWVDLNSRAGKVLSDLRQPSPSP